MLSRVILIPKFMYRTAWSRRVISLSLHLRLLFLCLQWPCTISSKHPPSQFFLWIAASSKRFLFTCTPSHPPRNPLCFFFLFRCTTASATHQITNANKLFCFLHRCFPGTLVTTDVGERGITSWVTDGQGVERCPYPTKVYALTHGDSFLAHSFLSLAVDHSFLYHFSFIPFQTRSGLFLFHPPPFLKAFSSFRFRDCGKLF
jgi:hypothetical protein